MEDLEFKNFRAREGLDAYARRRLKWLMKQTPAPSQITAAAMRLGSIFQFELKVSCLTEVFTCWVRVPTPLPPCDRLWQKQVIDSMIVDVSHQIERWKRL